MTEADFQYLLHALSEARSRATEIAVAVRSRVGVDHRLSGLGNSAVSQIENLLREIRRVAADQPGPLPSAGVRAAASPKLKSSTVLAENSGGSLAAADQHGLPSQGVRPAASPKPKGSTVPAENGGGSLPAAAHATDLASDHWFAVFVDDLVAQAGEGISFETVERLLQQRKQDFLKDLETTRRMYRTYPYLFQEANTAKP